MKRKLFPLLVILNLGIISCRQTSEKGRADENESGGACYLYVNNKDSVWMHINVTDNKVSGELSYLFFEKDKSRGTMKGQMNGDTLIADYEFMSEGVQSGREVMFLRQGNDFVEVYRGTLGYTHGTLLKQVPCD